MNTYGVYMYNRTYDMGMEIYPQISIALINYKRELFKNIMSDEFLHFIYNESTKTLMMLIVYFSILSKAKNVL